MKLLLVNDDGIFAKGLFVLAKTLSKKHDITVVAPEAQRSAKSHSVSLWDSLTVTKIDMAIPGVTAYSCSGSPADCTKVGLFHIGGDFDMVISGINNGWNLGTDCTYSGTVSAAMEAAFCGKRAIAISEECKDGADHFEFSAEFLLSFLDKVDTIDFSPCGILNINTPQTDKPNGVKLALTAPMNYRQRFEILSVNGDKELIQIACELPPPSEKNTDFAAVLDGYISLTPIKWQLTDEKLFSVMQTMFD